MPSEGMVSVLVMGAIFSECREEVSLVPMYSGSDLAKMQFVQLQILIQMMGLTVLVWKIFLLWIQTLMQFNLSCNSTEAPAISSTKTIQGASLRGLGRTSQM